MSRIVHALVVGMSSMFIALGAADSAVAVSPDRPPAQWTVVETMIDPLDEQCPEIITHPPIGPGDTGPVVRHLQCLLRERGFDIPIDGVFGPETRVALLAFQRQCGLPIDGTVGPQTWRALHIGC